MPLKITSADNPRIKQIIKLRNGSNRKESGLTIVEGLKEVNAALNAKIKIEKAYICPELLKEEGKGLLKKINQLKISLTEISHHIFEKISYGDRQEGLLLIAAVPDAALSTIALSKHPLLMVIEHVEKPGNLGAILRTAEAAGVDGVIVTDAKTDLYNPNVIRASLGTVFTLNVVMSTNEDASQFLKAKNISICAARPNAKRIYTESNFKKPTALVVGSEEKGLSDFWVDHANEDVKIPMKGAIDSLNVSTSAAILLYEAIRQRSQ